MSTGGIIFLMVLMIACGVALSLYTPKGIEGTASTIDELPAQATLLGSTLWEITIFRKSGYLHDVREVKGNAAEALAKAITSCRKSGIFSVIITQNEPNLLEFYSANQNGRGKAIGGFRIAPASEPAALEATKDIQQRAEQLGAELQDTKRALAAMLFESIKPGLNEKQKEVLGTLTEDQIITAMASQLDGTATSPFTFDIPIDFTDEDGNHYANIKLTVVSDTAA